MDQALSAAIERAVASWPGVTTALHSRGVGVQFHYGRVELGHLHGSSCADLPFPRKIRDELIMAGRAAVHDPLPDSGWARRRMVDRQDALAVIELFRMNYDRATARAAQHAPPGGGG